MDAFFGSYKYASELRQQIIKETGLPISFGMSQNKIVSKVATGEAVQNRIIFKQLISEQAVDIIQVDACRMGGLNEVIAVQLMAAKYNIPVWPHAGGVGLCEYSQHLGMIDYLCVSADKSRQVIEYVDHLHEHFINPCQIEKASYTLPKESGFSVEMKKETLQKNLFTG